MIVGVQQYNGQSDSSQQPEAPVFNTMPMMGTSPVSLGVPADASAGSGQQAQVQEQRRELMLCCRTMNCSVACMRNSFSLARPRLSKPLFRCRLSNFRNTIAVMKQLWCAMSLMAGSLFFSVNASADTSSGALLQQMNLASQSLNYELSFVSINKQGVESLRYRHAKLNNRTLAQLLQLDGPRRRWCCAERKSAILSPDSILSP